MVLQSILQIISLNNCLPASSISETLRYTASPMGKYFWKWFYFFILILTLQDSQKIMYVRLSWMINVLWFSFFSNWLFSNISKKKLTEFQIFFPISAKVMPWSLWKWLCPQCIFEGKHFPNSIGYSPGKAQVTNIDLKCSFFTGLQKVKAGSQFFSNCAWGFHEDGYWNQPW